MIEVCPAPELPCFRLNSKEYRVSPGPWQIVIIAVIILLLFGASRLGDIGKGLGEGIRNFKKGIADDDAKSADKKKQDDSAES